MVSPASIMQIWPLTAGSTMYSVHEQARKSCVMTGSLLILVGVLNCSMATLPIGQLQKVWRDLKDQKNKMPTITISFVSKLIIRYN